MKLLPRIAQQIIGSFILLFVAISALAQTVPNTSVTVCENIIQNFNKSTLSNLFNQDAEIKLQARYHFIDIAHSGCVIHAMVKFPNASYNLNTNNGYYDLGSAIIFRQSNSVEMYESNKRAFAAANSIFNWSETLPYVKTGYVDPTNPGYQIFDALLTDGDYVIFTYKGVNDSNTSTPTSLDPNFAAFINAMSSQIIGN